MALALPVDEAARAPHRYLRAPVPLEFPEQECLSDSDEHFARRILLWESVRLALGDQALVSSDQFVYFDPTDPKKCLSPDLGVRLGVPRRRIPSWKTWEWGAPQVGVEIVSPSDSPRRVELRKLERYRQAGILEIVWFQPEERALPLRFWDLVGGDLVERDPSAPETRRCDALGWFWYVREEPGLGPALRLTRDREGKDLVLSPAETERAAKEVALAATEAALARVAELEAELAQKATSGR
jgi:Uma2 family endonuclease